ncbi:MAG TPA: VOC family protein [Gammaproteobacteria bacterium]|nr:VOC family protein [Gammaproteobacteria bacterium]
MSTPNPYLVFDGDCADAMRFYEQTLGGKLELLMRFADSPFAAQTPKDEADRILHARLALPSGGALMASDATRQHPYQGKHGFGLSLIYASVAEAKQVFEKLAEGGQVTMPLDKTFWAETFGMVTDRFGTPWMINGGAMQAL